LHAAAPSCSACLYLLSDGFLCAERLDIRSNVDLEGTLHNEIGLLTNLRDFKISWTKTQGTIPTEVGHLTLLEHFSAHGCNLGGVIPFEEITGLTSLAKLDLGFGYFDRSRLPTTIGMMTNLVSLALSSCGVTGTLPTEITRLTSIGRIIMNKNDLSGTIPEALDELTKLVYLDLRRNLLSGTIPEFLCSGGKSAFADCDVECTCCAECT